MINRRMTNKQNVHRRIGGLENDADLHLFDRAVHRRIGGLEKTRTAPMVG